MLFATNEPHLRASIVENVAEDLSYALTTNTMSIMAVPEQSRGEMQYLSLSESQHHTL